MVSLNKCCFIGRVANLETKTANSGKEFSKFSLAINENYKKDNQIIEKTTWVSVVVYSPGLANIVKMYVKKGSKLYIEGQLQTRKWTGTDGIEKYATEIVLQGFNAVLQILDSNRTGEEGPLTKEEAKNTFSEASFIDNDNIVDENEFIDEKIDDDIPF